MARIYLDSSVLIAFLFDEEAEHAERFDQSRQLMVGIQEGLAEAIVSFYALPELDTYVEEEYPEGEIGNAFRSSLVQLFSFPIIIKPFLDRDELKDQCRI